MSLHHCGIPTFLGQVELFELGPLLVELGLQLLLEFDELGPLLLQSCHSLLERLWMMEKGGEETQHIKKKTVINQLLITYSSK